MWIRTGIRHSHTSREQGPWSLWAKGGQALHSADLTSYQTEINDQDSALTSFLKPEYDVYVCLQKQIVTRILVRMWTHLMEMLANNFLCLHIKLNSLHIHYNGVAEAVLKADISKPQQIKPKLPPHKNTIMGMFDILLIIWANLSFNPAGSLSPLQRISVKTHFNRSLLSETSSVPKARQHKLVMCLSNCLTFWQGICSKV